MLFGCINNYIPDTRTPKVSEFEVHAKKMHSVSVNPSSPHLIATAYAFLFIYCLSFLTPRFQIK